MPETDSKRIDGDRQPCGIDVPLGFLRHRLTQTLRLPGYQERQELSIDGKRLKPAGLRLRTAPANEGGPTCCTRR